jgi:hypothetical protein
MALTFGNMDQQVQQQADAFSDNPAALQQRYQQSQQLLDLLALQKIKSDKEAAAREMQMQMEQRPQTIAQQREAEVMGLTKDELAKQISDIMAQRQAVEQSNIKRAASGQPPRQRMAMAPPMRNPRTEGVASQRADNMVNMAQGGIVGFEPGGRVEGGVTDEQLKAMGITPSAWAVMSERDKALAIRSRLQGDRSLPSVTPELRGRKGSMRPGLDAMGQSAADRDLMSGKDLITIGSGPLNPSDKSPFTLIQSSGDREKIAAAVMAAREAERQKGMSPGQVAALATATNPNAAVPVSLAGLEASALGDMYAPGPAAPVAPAAPPPALAAPATGITTVPRVATPTFGDYRAQEAAIADSYRKQGILEELEEGAKRRAKMIADQQAARTRNPLRGLMTGASAFGRMGRGIAATREAEAAADLRNLGLEIDDVEKRLGVEEKISGAQITGATNRIKYATDIAIANADNETKAAVSKVAADASNYAAQLTARYQNATTENEKRKLAIDAENAKTQRISELLKLRDAQIQGLLLSPEYASADSEGRKVIRNRLEETYKPLLLEVRSQFDKISGKSSLPNSADGAATRKTSP